MSNANIEGDEATWSFAKFLRGIFLHPDACKMFDILTLLDLRQRVATAKAGELLMLDDAAWNALSTLTKNPVGIQTWAVYQMEPFIRAVLDATTDAPAKTEVSKKKANGALEQESKST